MKKHGGQKITAFFVFFCLTMSFSFNVFSAPFTGAYLSTEIDPVTGIPTTVVKDVNPANQTFSGQNVIELNAYNNAPVLNSNTFNGSTEINPDFTSITSNGNNYNGSVDLTYYGMGGTFDSEGDRFQSTTVTAESSDISISNGTFNGSTTINAQSVSLGSISQMDNLLDELYALMRSITVAATSNTRNPTVTNPWTGNTVTLELNTIAGEQLVYDSTNHTLTVSAVGSGWPYGNYHARVVFFHTCMINSLNSLGQFISYWVNNIFDNSATYRIYSFTSSGETYSFTSANTTTSFRTALLNRFDVLIQLLNWFCSRFFEWYYPLDNVLPEYWRYYNTDTAQQEEIGLAGLMYNISWYLGQLYVLQTASEALDNFEDQVAAVTDTFEDAEAAEESIMQSINSGISSFNPDVNQFGAFRALGWCSNYLQLVFLRLGTYGTVLLIGLLLGVCMQFVGYFRYK